MRTDVWGRPIMFQKTFRIVRDEDGYGIQRKILFFWVEAVVSINEGGGKAVYRYPTEKEALEKLHLIVQTKAKELVSHIPPRMQPKPYTATVYRDGSWKVSP